MYISKSPVLIASSICSVNLTMSLFLAAIEDTGGQQPLLGGLQGPIREGVNNFYLVAFRGVFRGPQRNDNIRRERGKKGRKGVQELKKGGIERAITESHANVTYVPNFGSF